VAEDWAPGRAAQASASASALAVAVPVPVLEWVTGSAEAPVPGLALAAVQALVRARLAEAPCGSVRSSA